MPRAQPPPRGRLGLLRRPLLGLLLLAAAGLASTAFSWLYLALPQQARAYNSAGSSPYSEGRSLLRAKRHNEQAGGSSERGARRTLELAEAAQELLRAEQGSGLREAEPGGGGLSSPLQQQQEEEEHHSSGSSGDSSNGGSGAQPAPDGTTCQVRPCILTYNFCFEWQQASAHADPATCRGGNEAGEHLSPSRAINGCSGAAAAACRSAR